jgi:hypothetical protein
METFLRILSRLRTFLQTPFLKLGETQITFLSILYFALLLLLLIYLSGKVRKVLVDRLLAKTRRECGRFVRQRALSLDT